jgi:ATP/maltotriose-dependent transcriptional regulator MalT
VQVDEGIQMAETTLTYIEALTERETEVLLLMAEGLSDQEISNELFIALTTVK